MKTQVGPYQMPTQVTHKKEYKHHTDALQKTHAPEKKNRARPQNQKQQIKQKGHEI